MLKLLPGALAAFALLFVACSGGGGSSGSATPQPSLPPDAQTVIAATAAVPSPTTAPDEATAVAAGVSVDLAEYQDPGGRYTVKLPRGWIREDSVGGTTVRLPNNPVTTIGIWCQQGDTVAQLQALDQKYAVAVGQRVVNSTDQLQVAGTSGIIVKSTTTLSSLVLHNTSVYFEGKGCAWRVQLTSAIKDQDFTPLLGRVIQTFSFT